MHVVGGSGEGGGRVGGAGWDVEELTKVTSQGNG